MKEHFYLTAKKVNKYGIFDAKKVNKFCNIYDVIYLSYCQKGKIYKWINYV